MSYKIVVRMVQHTADANPDKQWMSPYFGVIESKILSQIDSNPMLRALAPPYAMMCGAIDNFSLSTCEWCLTEIQKLENGEVEEVDSSTEAYVFLLRNDRPISFEFQYGENGPEKGGEVSLAQFKLAVQTYLQFLRDPERKPIEVPFPE